MSDKVLVQFWHNQKLWSECEVDLDGDLATRMDDVDDMLHDALTAIEPGEGFTLTADRL